MEPREADFPGGPVVKNPPSNSVAMGSTRNWGDGFPHATEH